MNFKELFKKKTNKEVDKNSATAVVGNAKNSAASTANNQQSASNSQQPTTNNFPIQVVSRAGLDEEDIDIIAKQGSTKPEIIDPNKAVAEGMAVLDAIAPKTFEIDFDFIKINGVFFRTLFVSGYPRFVSPGWLEQIINFDSSLDISFYVYPVEVKGVLEDLRHKIAEMEAEIATDLERGRIVNATTQAKLDDAQVLQEELVKGAEHFYEFAFYITIPAQDLEDLDDVTKQVQATLGSLLVNAQVATLDMENGFYSTIPFATDRLSITRNMDTTSLSTTFPLTSAELSSDTGVLYGINPLNDSFIIFDRFSMENSNMAIFATSGAGKSVAYDTPVIFRDNNRKVYLEKIGTIVERLFREQKSQRFDNELEGVIKPGIDVYGFNKEMNTEWSEVTVAARKTFDGVMYKVRTQSGREIMATKDHNFVVLEEGKVKTTRGGAVRKGMFVPLSRNVQYTTVKNTSISIEKSLCGSNTSYLKLPNGRIKHPYHGSNKSLPSKITITPLFAKLLGYFASEGMIKTNRALITSVSPTVLKDVSNYYQSIGLSYSYIKRVGKLIGVYVSSHLFCQFLKNLGSSGKAGKKRVPSLIFSLTDKFSSLFLSAYFEGDGGVENHEITATTKSKDLVSDLSYLLLRFGVITRIRKKYKAATNTKHKTKRAYYQITISGQDNIRKFIKSIGFISEKKNGKAVELYKSENTNVDIIPEISGIFKEIYNVLYKSSEIPAPKMFSEIKLGIFNPSPKILMSLVEKMEDRVKEIEELETDGLSTLNNLPTIAQILDKGKEKGLNTFLWKKLGKSWWTMKNKYPPKLSTVLKAAEETHNFSYSQIDITGAVYRTFQKTGESLRGLIIRSGQQLLIKNKTHYLKR